MMISAHRLSILHGIANEEMFYIVPINMLNVPYSHDLVACGALIEFFCSISKVIEASR